MLKSKKMLFSFTLMMLVSSLMACSSNYVNTPDTVSAINKAKFNKLVQDISSRGKAPYIVDMGDKNGPSFAVQINIKNDSGFSTKADSVSGHHFLGTDINIVKVFIFAASSFSSGATDIVPDTSMPSDAEITLPTDSKTGTAAGGSFDVVFTNVPGNANPWRVAVTALTTQTAAGGSSGTPRNITLGTGATSFLVYDGENYAVSNAGGDSDSGSVLIDATELTLTGTAALVVPLQLIAADGATIGSTVNITNGSSTPTGDVDAD